MAETSEVVQRIALDGDAEVLHKLHDLGEQGAEAIEKLCDAAAKGASGFEIFGNSVAIAASAIVGATTTMLAFLEANDDAIQKTAFLAEAFGTTTSQLLGIEAAFAEAGVGAKQFEQFAQRLTITIARLWPAIAESNRTAATETESDNERMEQSILRIADAQRNLQFVGQETAQKLEAASLREAEALLKLQNAAADAYSEMIRGQQSVEAANLSLEAAEQRLATLQGRPPSAADKQALEVKQAQLAVDKARQESEDALRKQQEQAAEAALKKEKIEQEAAEASLKRAKADAEASEARVKAELAVREAITRRAEVEERAAQQALKSIPDITKALQGMIDGNKAAAESIDVTEVSVQNLVKSIINLASNGKEAPKGLDVMIQLSKLLSSETGKLIDQNQRLAIVQQLSRRGFGSTSIAAAELLKALERGPKFFDDYVKASKNLFNATDEDIHKAEEFRHAMEGLSFSVDQVNKAFASAASPIFTELLTAINNSLSKSGGLLHAFVEGIKGIGSAIGSIIEVFQKAFEAVDHVFNLQQGRAFQLLIVAIVGIVVAFASAWLAVPAGIVAVITAVGVLADNLKGIQEWIDKNKAAAVALGIAIAALLVFIAPIPAAIGLIAAAIVFVVTNWDKVKEAAKAAIDYIVNSPLGKWITGFLDKLKQAVDLLKILLGFGGNGDKSSGSQGQGQGQPAQASEGDSKGFATGGFVSGPGTGTSDSIPARLSNGEFVVRAASVQKFGADFFHALNNMAIPGFASGGLVGAPARSGLPSSMQASRPLNLTIDGHTFNGLRGPKSVVDSLATYAVARQTASAGTKPSWVR